MRRGFIFFVGILALALVPAMACAQYSGAFGLSGLPSMPSLFGGSGNCGGGAKCPAFVPELYVGWGIPQNRNTSVSLSADTGAATVRNISLQLPTDGLWLGTALPLSLTENLSFVATGWYLFGGANKLNSREDNGIIAGGTLGNNWNVTPTWWFADGALAYTFGGPCCGGITGGGFSLLLGLRYDYYEVQITSPDNVNVLLVNGGQGDVYAKSWIPFVGFQCAYKDTVQNLNVRLLGIPTNTGTCYTGMTTALGRFEFGENNYSKGGYFYEIFGEYTRQFFGASQAGVFLRWNTTNAKSSGSGRIAAANTSDTYNLSLYRSSWTLGGVVTLDFNTPFCN